MMYQQAVLEPTQKNTAVNTFFLTPSSRDVEPNFEEFWHRLTDACYYPQDYDFSCLGTPGNMETRAVILPMETHSNRLINQSIWFQINYHTTRVSLSRKKRNWIKEAQELFPEARHFTEEEAKAYNQSLFKIFKPTGRNFFDL